MNNYYINNKQLIGDNLIHLISFNYIIINIIYSLMYDYGQFRCYYICFSITSNN